MNSFNVKKTLDGKAFKRTLEKVEVVEVVEVVAGSSSQVSPKKLVSTK